MRQSGTRRFLGMQPDYAVDRVWRMGRTSSEQLVNQPARNQRSWMELVTSDGGWCALMGALVVCWRAGLDDW